MIQYEPTIAEVDAGEVILAEALGCPVDGWCRPIVADILRAAQKESWSALLGALEAQDRLEIASPLAKIQAFDAELAELQREDRELAR